MIQFLGHNHLSSGAELPSNWQWARLGDVADFENGDRGKNYPSNLDRVASGVPFINTGHIEPSGRLSRDKMEYISRSHFERLRAGRVRTGDILYCLRGSTIGKIAINEYSEGAIASSLVIIRGNKRIAQEYLYYYLAGPIGQGLVKHHDNGSAQPNLSVASISEYPIPLPPIELQSSIAETLRTLDDKIELNRRMNETLEAMARAIFRDWFVDFGPTRAKAEGREPYLAEHIWSLFPDRLDPITGLPEGWSEVPIYEAASVIYGAPFASKLFNSNAEGVPLLRIRDLAAESPGVWTTEVHPKGYKVKPGDLVVGMDGEFRAHLWGGAEVWLNQRVCVFNPKPDYSAAFVRNAIAEPLAHIEATEIATTVIHLGKSDIDEFKFVDATHAVRLAYNSSSQPMYDRIVRNKIESRTLAETRDYLLPKLMSGEIRVRDAEKMIEDAA